MAGAEDFIFGVSRDMGMGARPAAAAAGGSRRERAPRRSERSDYEKALDEDASSLSMMHLQGDDDAVDTFLATAQRLGEGPQLDRYIAAAGGESGPLVRAALGGAGGAAPSATKESFAAPRAEAAPTSDEIRAMQARMSADTTGEAGTAYPALREFAEDAALGGGLVATGSALSSPAVRGFIRRAAQVAAGRAAVPVTAATGLIRTIGRLRRDPVRSAENLLGTMGVAGGIGAGLGALASVPTGGATLPVTVPMGAAAGAITSPITYGLAPDLVEQARQTAGGLQVPFTGQNVRQIYRGLRQRLGI